MGKNEACVAGAMDVRLEPGDHLCLVYGSDEEHRRAASAFIRQGLENGEKVVYIADVRTAKSMLRLLEREGFSAYGHMARGDFQVLASKNAYLRGGRFEPEAMLRFLENESETALGKGYAALRVAGETGWVLSGAAGAERLLEYESAASGLFDCKKCLALCMYDSRKFPEEILRRVIFAHPAVLDGTRALKNFYYSPGGGHSSENSAESVQLMLENLRVRAGLIR